ncbi:flagellar basal body P-ring protein FlgI [Sphingopyxis sp. KK2]|uniref:flagellar basal body P-ring protein FlgI n=1 Tax=Sphingopyxis sp. KK2 TaxID=1855727 RepID=UPI00097E60D3|nr:flagellar basal body P-ring protein FlgI [Sphingopyxis sp. KK2]
MRRLLSLLVAAAVVVTAAPAPAAASEVQLTALGRFAGWRQNALIGYGLVTGLAGSGDTRRSEVTRQALRNVLARLGTAVTEEQINSRNVAVVIVTAVLPASANPGDRIDISISSIGDARSLAGGTLLMTPLLGPDQRPYTVKALDLARGQDPRRAAIPCRGARPYPSEQGLPRLRRSQGQGACGRA